MRNKALKLTPEQILTAIDRLTLGEQETLEILADNELVTNILRARARVRQGEGIDYVPAET